MAKIQQEIEINGSPEAVYGILSDGDRFSEISGGAPAKIGARDGDEFSCFGGMIHGRIIEQTRGKNIVQAWRVKDWPAGEYSLVQFKMEPSEKGTRLSLTHTGFPSEQQKHLAEGWNKNYLEPMEAAFHK